MNTIEHGGFVFGVELLPDDYMRGPWEEHDGHGPVSGWRPANYAGRIPTAPGERVLHRDGRSGLVYDVKGAMEIALRDGWGIDPATQAHRVRQLGRPMTRREIAAAAVDADYWRLRRWCEGEWHWVTLRVVLLDSDGAETTRDAFLGGIESDAGDYFDECARELADEIIAGLPDVPTCSHCGGESVSIDATARWDRVAGAWALSGTHDAAFCDECDGETSLTWKGG